MRVTATPNKGYKISEVETGVSGPSLVRDPSDGTRYTFAMPARDVTARATFVLDEDAWATVIFDRDGGELTGRTDVRVVIGEPLSSVDDFRMPTAKMHGFKDEGWSRTKTSIGGETTAIEIGVDTPITADMLDANRELTLYPRWTEDPEQQLTITFDADGEYGGRIKGTNESVAIRYAKYDPGLGGFRLADNDVPEAEVAGYTNDGWVDGDGKWFLDYGGRFYGDVRFTAHWELDGNQWTTVVFDPSPWTTDDRTEFEVITGRPLSSADGFSMPAVTRPGYLNPTVWKTGNGNEIGESTVITEEMGDENRRVTLRPQWVPDDSQWWTVTFDAAGGSPEPTAIHVLKGKSPSNGIRDGESYPADPTRTGYSFGGWWLGEDRFTENSTVDGDVAATARWDPDETSSEWATVTFDANGGQLNGASEIHVLKGKSSQDGIRDGESYPADPTRHGYIFIEWLADGTELTADTMAVGDMVATASWVVDGSLATWCTVTYVADGGTADRKSERVVRSGTVGSLPGAMREGWVLAGWYDGDRKVGDAGGESSPITEDIVLRARWTAPAAPVEVTVDDGIRAEIDGEPFHGGSVPPGTVIRLEADESGSIRASDGTELGSGGDYVVRGPVDFTIEKENGQFPWLLLLLVLLAVMCAATYCHRRRSQRDRE